MKWEGSCTGGFGGRREGRDERIAGARLVLMTPTKAATLARGARFSVMVMCCVSKAWMMSTSNDVRVMRIRIVAEGAAIDPAATGTNTPA